MTRSLKASKDRDVTLKPAIKRETVEQYQKKRNLKAATKQTRFIM